jgi:VCBS repeat-containing protein
MAQILIDYYLNETSVIKRTKRAVLIGVLLIFAAAFLGTAGLSLAEEAIAPPPIDNPPDISRAASAVEAMTKSTNEAATLGATNVVLTETNEALSTKGVLSLIEGGHPATFVAQEKAKGKYGTFQIDPTGAWSYVTKSALDELNVGQSVSDIFRVVSTAGTSTSVKITIQGTNDPAILGVADVQLTETNTPLKTGGRLSIKDVDSPQTFVAQNKVAGANGRFSIDTSGRWTYVANNALDYLNVGKSVKDSFTVVSADGTPTTVQVTINGSNDPAVVGAADVVLTQTNTPLSTSGILSNSDVDNIPTFVAQSKVAGAYGTFNINETGVWTYVANSAFTYLKVGQKISDSFDVTTGDGTRSKVKITINGSNDPAILSSASVVLEETNTRLETAGALTITDVDSPQTFVAHQEVGKYGIFKINKAGAWTYVTNSALDELNVGQSVIDNFAVTSADGTPTTVQITINGTNDPAVLSAADVILTESDVPLKATGKLSITDVDSPQTFVAQSRVAGAHGVFNIDSSGAWSYLANTALDELNIGQSVRESFTVTSADGTPTTVKVTINGSNDPATLSAADVVMKQANAPQSIGGKLDIRDVDSPQTFIAQNNIPGTNGIFNIDSSGVWTYVTNNTLGKLNVGQSAADIFSVTSADGTTTTVRVTINGTK